MRNRNRNRVAILIVAFLGTPETIASKLRDSEIRYQHTKNAFLEIKKNIGNQSIFLGLVGDESECKRFINECNLNENNSKLFDQDRTLITRGTGALENQLIMNCIKNWSLEKRFDVVIKITGKYQVLNLHNVINFSTTITQQIYAWRIKMNDMVDTRVFLFNPNFYLQNQELLKKVNSMPGWWFENIIFKLMEKMGYSPGILCCRPMLKGLAGTTNEFTITPLYKRTLIKFSTLIYIIYISFVFNKIKF